MPSPVSLTSPKVTLTLLAVPALTARISTVALKSRVSFIGMSCFSVPKSSVRMESTSIPSGDLKFEALPELKFGDNGTLLYGLDGLDCLHGNRARRIILLAGDREHTRDDEEDTDVLHLGDPSVYRTVNSAISVACSEHAPDKALRAAGYRQPVSELDLS